MMILVRMILAIGIDYFKRQGLKRYEKSSGRQGNTYSN